MVKPTIVVGLGKAGCRMASTLSQIVETEDKEDKFEFITVDSNEDDLYRFSPDSGNPKHLTKPKRFWDRHKSEFSYLRPDFVLATGEGTIRQRAVARYHVESTENFDDLRLFLENRIDGFVEERVSALEQDVADVNIWIVNSLGGGTGSGSFPLVGTLIKKITDGSEYDFFIGGIGSLPRLDDLESMIGVPEGNGDFYANSYAALRELKELINYDDDSDRYPIEIKLEGDHEDIPGSSLKIDESPFDMYCLLGFDEGEQSQHYRQQMNRIGAQVIFYHANIASSENFPDDEAFGANKDRILYAINATEVHAPIENARTYVDLRNKIHSIETTIEDLDRETESIEQDINYLNELRILTLNYKELPAEIERVDTELIRKSRQEVNNFDPHTVTNLEFDTDEVIDSLHRRVEDDIPEGRYEARDVVTRVYCEQLETYLNDIVAGHRFNESVEKIWTEYQNRLVDIYPYLAEDEPIDKWENGVEEFLYETGKELKQQADDIVINRLKKRRLNNQVNRLRQQIKQLTALNEEYEKLTELQNEARSRTTSTRQSLLKTQQSLERRAEETRREQRQNEHDLSNTVEKRSRIAEQLADDWTVAGRYVLPMQNVEEITRETVDSNDSIADLVAEGKIDKGTLALAIRNRLQALEYDPVQDLAVDDTFSTKSILGILTHEENVGGGGDEGDVRSPRENLLSMDVPGRMNLSDEVNDIFNYYNEDENLVYLKDGFSIWFVSFYTDISLYNMSEFGTIHNLYSNPDRQVSEELGPDFSDEEVALKFAYPELVPDDHIVQSKFSNKGQ